jgi:uncharacterized membrane protein
MLEMFGVIFLIILSFIGLLLILNYIYEKYERFRKRHFVIYCKNCKYYGDKDWCRLYYYMGDNDYCSRGEIK